MASARPPVRRQGRLDFRDLLAGGGSARAGVADGIAAAAGDGVASGEKSAHYGRGVLCGMAVLASAFGGLARAHAGGRGEAEPRGREPDGQVVAAAVAQLAGGPVPGRALSAEHAAEPGRAHALKAGNVSGRRVQAAAARHARRGPL